jgi:hypothetical protein
MGSVTSASNRYLRVHMLTMITESHIVYAGSYIGGATDWWAPTATRR